MYAAALFSMPARKSRASGFALRSECHCNIGANATLCHFTFRKLAMAMRKSIRQLLLELWAVLLLASIVGFMGPFGAYNDDGLVSRIVHWWQLLMGAYLLIRPSIIGLNHLALKTDLPKQTVVFWGVVVLSVPLSILWRNIGQDEFRKLDGYAGLLPFSLLCALAVLGVTQWALHADKRLRVARSPDAHARSSSNEPAKSRNAFEPALKKRLSSAFVGPIVALQSEDHYVRVHGEKNSELILIRLRDAVAEMEGVEGWQVHRSWWVARDGIVRATPSGRSWALTLKNDSTALVARDMIERLKATGVLKV